jgi:hypothetical protein
MRHLPRARKNNLGSQRPGRKETFSGGKMKSYKHGSRILSGLSAEDDGTDFGFSGFENDVYNYDEFHFPDQENEENRREILGELFNHDTDDEWEGLRNNQ